MHHLELKVSATYCNRWPTLWVDLNGVTLTETVIDCPKTISVLLHSNLEKNKLSIGMKGKQFGEQNIWDTQVDEQGKIINDLQLVFDDVKLEDVSILDLLIKHQYYADDTHGQPIQNAPVLVDNKIGFNGSFTFEYTLPVLNSITNQKFKLPLNEDISYFSNYTALFHYEEDQRLINEIQDILDDVKKLSS